MPKLGFNVDHVATLRQARRARYPDPVEAALAAERAGADAITVHLREDRRHIQDNDLVRIREAISIRLNQEMAPTAEMLEIAIELRPDEVCIVPERREELTTEGGLDAAGMRERLRPIIERLKMSRVGVSLFIDPEPHQIEAAADLGADFIEIHTGAYANLFDDEIARAEEEGTADEMPPLKRKQISGNSTRGGKSLRDDGMNELTRVEFEKIRAAVKLARSMRLKPNVGHGLNYRNVSPIAALPGLAWLHIGHSIVARAVMIGMQRAVREMITAVNVRSRPAASGR